MLEALLRFVLGRRRDLDDAALRDLALRLDATWRVGNATGDWRPFDAAYMRARCRLSRRDLGRLHGIDGEPVSGEGGLK